MNQTTSTTEATPLTIASAPSDNTMRAVEQMLADRRIAHVAVRLEVLEGAATTRDGKAIGRSKKVTVEMYAVDSQPDGSRRFWGFTEDLEDDAIHVEGCLSTGTHAAWDTRWLKRTSR